MSVVKALLCSILISFSISLMAADATKIENLQLYFGDFLELGDTTKDRLMDMLTYSSTIRALKLKNKRSSYAVLSAALPDSQQQINFSLGPKSITFRVNPVHSEYQLLSCDPVSVADDAEFKEVDTEDTDKNLFFSGINYLVALPDSAIKAGDFIKINGVRYRTFKKEPT